MADLYTPEGKTFLVTGGASGMGAQFVEKFVKEGAKAVAILDVQVDNGTKLAEQMNTTYPSRVIFVKCDVTDEKNIEEAFNYVLEKFERLDVIINNAGIMSDTPGTWRKASNLNWIGLVDLTLRGVQHMRKDEGGAGGTIINVSSIAALMRYNFMPIYNGSKAAVLHFGQSISYPTFRTLYSIAQHHDHGMLGYADQTESGGSFYEHTGVRVLTVCFGATDTPLVQGSDLKIWDKCVLKDLLTLSFDMQRIESAVAAVLEMFNKGANGSIWLSIDDKPAKDITPEINALYTELERIIFS